MCWHKWEYIPEYFDNYFLGKKFKDSWDRFRRCTKCGIVQEYTSDSQGGGWNKLNGQKLNIFNSAKLLGKKRV